MSTNGSVLVGTWQLQETAAKPESAEDPIPVDHGGEEGESTFDVDKRELVPPTDYGPGGKFRSIVKLQMKYEHQAPDDERVAMGTGWLIRPDLMATAGHNVYDWKNQFGRCIEMKAYIGYNGKESALSDPNVQFRKAKRVATTQGWLTSAENRHHDVSFVQLDKPFTGIAPFQFTETPTRGDEVLGVVGYPADRKLKSERGAQMYQEFSSVNYDLSKSQRNMLEYRINSYGGQSGSPVLRNDHKTAIGAHVYGGGDKNKASVILGQYGNPYWSYISVFDKQYPIATAAQGISFIQANVSHGPSISHPVENPNTGILSSGPANKGISQGGFHTAYTNTGFSQRGFQPVNSSFQNKGFQPVNKSFQNQVFKPPITTRRTIAHAGEGAESSLDDSEGFMDIMKRVIKIGAPIASTVLSVGTPFLGPVGAPVAALAGTVLNAASKMAESAMDGMPPARAVAGVAASSPETVNNHAASAIMGQAALQTVMGMDKDQVAELGIFDTMKDAFHKIAPGMVKVAPHLLHVVAEPALRIALDRLRHLEETGQVEKPLHSRRRAVKKGAESEFAGDPQVDAFQAALLKPTYPVEGEESFFSHFGHVVSGALSTVKKDVSGANSGLTALNSILPESEMEPTEMEQQMHDLCYKHAMGQAALHALIQVDPDHLEQEGFIDNIKTVAQQIGGAVMKTAPSVIKAALPIVNQILGHDANAAVHSGPVTGMLGSPAMLGTSSMHGGSTTMPSRGLRKKKSFVQHVSEHPPYEAMGSNLGTRPASALRDHAQHGKAPNSNSGLFAGSQVHDDNEDAPVFTPGDEVGW